MAQIMPSMRHMLFCFCHIGLLYHLLGCAASSPQQPSTPFGPSAAREEFDPYTLNDDDFLLRPTASPVTPISPVREPTTPIALPQRTLSKKTEGYRVQIAAVLDRTRADMVLKRIQADLQTLTYVIYDEETHLYRIQAGNCQTPAEAEALRNTIKTQGFQEAYVVRTQIEVSDVQAPISRPQVTQGFRVQLFSASTRQAAEEARSQAQNQLGRDDVFIDFEPPYFKVRIGNFKTREEAEKLLDLAQKKGFETPFVVQTQIRLSPR